MDSMEYKWLAPILAVLFILFMDVYFYDCHLHRDVEIFAAADGDDDQVIILILLIPTTYTKRHCQLNRGFFI